jgi:hypothetical protein
VPKTFKKKVFRFTMQEVEGQELGQITDIVEWEIESDAKGNYPGIFGAFKQWLEEDARERAEEEEEEEEEEEILKCPDCGKQTQFGETCAKCENEIQEEQEEDYE